MPNTALTKTLEDKYTVCVCKIQIPTNDLITHQATCKDCLNQLQTIMLIKPVRSIEPIREDIRPTPKDYTSSLTFTCTLCQLSNMIHEEIVTHICTKHPASPGV